MDKANTLEELKSAWRQYNAIQKEITQIEKKLHTIDPSTNLTVWNTPQTLGVYNTIDKSQVENKQQIVREICETRHLIETLINKEFPEQAQPVIIGQTQNLLQAWLQHK